MEQHDNMVLVYQALTNYLKIPVLPNEMMSINLTRNGAGVSGWGAGTGGSVRYDTWAKTTVTDDACYFVVNNRATDDRVMDFSQVPGGYGIHMISYEYNPTEAGTMVDPDSLRMAYPLDDESWVVWLEHTKENDRLLLTTMDASGETVLSVIECSTMKTLQEITLYQGADVESFYMAVCEDDYVAIHSAGNRIILLEETSDGTYDLAIDITVENYQTVGYGFHTTLWDGEKPVPGIRSTGRPETTAASVWVCMTRREPCSWPSTPAVWIPRPIVPTREKIASSGRRILCISLGNDRTSSLSAPSYRETK